MSAKTLKKVVLHWSDGTGEQLLRAERWRQRITAEAGNLHQPRQHGDDPLYEWETHSPREKLPMTRFGRTGKFCFQAGLEDEVRGYIYANRYPDKRLGEVFIVFDRAGTLLRGMADAVATSLSIRLQRGETCVEVTDKILGTRFEPAGWTGNKIVPRATSVLDFTARWLRYHFAPEVAVEPVVEEPVIEPAVPPEAA